MRAASVTFGLNMDRLALMKRRTQFERRRDAELRECRTKWRRRINSIDRLLKVSAPAAEIRPQTEPLLDSPAATSPAHGGTGRAGRKVRVLEVVRQTLQQSQGVFTAKTLVAFINQTQPCAVTERAISQPLSNLRQCGEIRLLEKGRGGKPHTYFEVSTAPPPARGHSCPQQLPRPRGCRLSTRLFASNTAADRNVRRAGPSLDLPRLHLFEHVPELGQGQVLHLTDALAGEAELASYLLKRLLRPAVQPEAGAQDGHLARSRESTMSRSMPVTVFSSNSS